MISAWVRAFTASIVAGIGMGAAGTVPIAGRAAGAGGIAIPASTMAPASTLPHPAL
jgi:hypothetical protein